MLCGAAPYCFLNNTKIKNNMRKNINYILLLALSVIFFTACEDHYADQYVADPTINEQLPVYEVGGFSFAQGKDIASAIALSKEDLDNEKVFEVISTSAKPEFAQDANITFNIEASDSQDFENAIQIPSVSENNAATVSAQDLDDVVKELFGKAPAEHNLYLRATATVSGEDIILQIPTSSIWGPIAITPAVMTIENSYYLIGDVNDWTFGNLDDYKFNHSGKDVYEDPYFSILVNNLQGYFKIVPQSSKDADDWPGVIGNPVDGNTDLEGELVIDGQAMQVTEPGWVKITLNMLDYSYKIEIIGEMNLSLYMPGAYQGWSPETAPSVYSKNLDFKYEGYVYFGSASDFKFASQRNWDGPIYGVGDDEGTLSDTGGDLNISEAGYYKFNVDLSGSPYTYSATKTEWGLIGDATPGGWDSSTPMVYDETSDTWAVTAELTTGAYKFRANDGWDINLGGDLNDLNYDGDNINVEEAGTYKIVLDLSDPAIYKATVVKQ